MAILKLLTVLATLGVAYSQNSKVPVLIWGNHRSIDKMTLKETADNVEDLIMIPAVENDGKLGVLIGMLDSLSLSDLFKKHKNEVVFTNVKSMIDNSKYRNFLQMKRDEVNNSSLSDVQNVVTSKDSEVHVIKITPKGEDVTETLKMADKIMFEACKQHTAQYKSYICVMTGASGKPEGDHVRIARSLLQAPSEEPENIADISQNVFFVKDFALVYTKAQLFFENAKSTPATQYNLTQIGQPTSSIKDKILFVYFQDKAANSPKIRLAFAFENTSSTWSLTNILYGDDLKTSTPLAPSIPISTSFGYSFHTPSKVKFENTTEKIKIIFNSLQIEYNPNNLPTMKFDLADDTVYFFTIPILSGLFVTSLLVTIVLLGLSMIFDIKTMDLFDDPKGKTVTINASE